MPRRGKAASSVAALGRAGRPRLKLVFSFAKILAGGAVLQTPFRHI